MKSLKMNFTNRLRECCDRLSPRQRKAVVPRQPAVTLDSLGRMVPIDDTSNVIPRSDERADE